MKNHMKKIVAFLLVLFVGISLVACDDDKKTNYNTNVPYQGVTTADYATFGDSKLTNKQLYDLMRANGYGTLTNMIVEKLITPDSLGLSIDKNKEDLIELMNEQCFGTTELDKLNDTTKKQAVQKYVDNFKILGIEVKTNDSGTELKYEGKILDYYLPQLAQQEYTRNLFLNKDSKYYYANEFQVENGETLTEEHDGHTHELENPFYISEEDYQAQYEKNRAEKDEYEVVIVAFNTLEEAKKAYGDNIANITPEVIKKAYTDKYSYKGTADYNYTLEELSVYNQGLVTLIQNMEDGDYTKTPVQFGKNVYLVHLISSTPEVGEYTEDTTVKVEDLRDEIIDGYVTSSFISSAIGELVKSYTLTIYDPVYDALYAAENKDHKRLEASAWEDNGTLVSFTKDGKKAAEPITVSDFYTKLEDLVGVTCTLDYFLNEVLLDTEHELTSKEQEKIEKEINDAIKTFNDNGYESYGYPVSIGEEIFKFVYFGTSDYDQIVRKHQAQKMWDYILDEKSEVYYDALAQVSKQYYESYFNLSVKHVLVFVDYDMDGTPDDPDLYFQNFDADIQTEIKKEILKLSNAIVKEANYISEKGYMTLTDALSYVQKQFYANGNILHTEADDRWAEYKEYNLGVTIEDLGAVNTSNASKYVPEFGEGVQALYQHLLTVEGYEMGDEYLAEAASIDELIKTSFGYHTLAVYDADELTSAKFTAEEDTAKQYADDKITVTYKDENDEKQTLTFKNAYNENEWATKEQIKIYDAAMEYTGSVTSRYLPTDVKTYISYFYSSFEKRYEDKNVQRIFVTEEKLGDGQLTFANKANNAEFNELVEIQKSQYDSYKSLDNTMFAGWWDLFSTNLE